MTVYISIHSTIPPCWDGGVNLGGFRSDECSFSIFNQANRLKSKLSILVNDHEHKNQYKH